MSIQANKTMVGAFVLGAAVLLAGAILLLGTGRLLKTQPPVVLYFDGSVKGLSLGAPVIFRGVAVGAVTNIQLVVDASGLHPLIPVTVQMDPSKVQVPKSVDQSKNQTIYLKKLIDAGLRAQLGQQSFVTGQLMIELDILPGTEMRLRGDGSMIEIPTIPSPLDKLARTLQSIPVEQIMGQVQTAVEGLNKILSSPDLAKAPGELNATLRELRTLAQNLNGQVKPVRSSLDQTLASVATAAASADRVMRHAENVTDPNSQSMTDLRKALNELSNAARALRNLADYLDRHPEALIKGKGEYR
jgi:paraquat-inducible protein B